MDEEKRKFLRIPFEHEIFVTGVESGRIAGEMVDISLKGVLLKMPVQWKGVEKEPFQVELLLGEGEVRLTIDSIIVYHRGELVGFEFEGMDMETFSHLKRMMEWNTGDDKEINREIHELGK